jgi:hypothetical protein
VSVQHKVIRKLFGASWCTYFNPEDANMKKGINVDRVFSLGLPFPSHFSFFFIISFVVSQPFGGEFGLFL